MTQQPEREPEQQDDPVEPDGGVEDAPPSDPLVELQTRLDERTRDLQRLQAEYVNYKRRVDRDREAVRDTANAVVLGALLPVLDDIDRARQHGELTGGFKAVADALERTVTALGLVRFGDAGEPFDPRIHEALMHELSDEVAGPTAQTILQPGYRVGDRIVRPARVSVVEPATAAPTLDEPAHEVPAESDTGTRSETETETETDDSSRP